MRGWRKDTESLEGCATLIEGEQKKIDEGEAHGARLEDCVMV